MIEQIAFRPAQALSVEPKANGNTGATDVTKQFGAMLNDAMAKLSGQQAQVEQLNEAYIKGELSDVHQLTIAAEKVSLGLELTVQTRNKVIEAYQEIMRMQI